VRDLWSEWLARDLTVVSAPLIYAEVTSVLRGSAHRGAITEADAREHLSEVLSWRVVVWNEDQTLQRTAYDFAVRFNQPKAYDAQYLAVASLVGCDLWTLDKRLYNSVKQELPWVRYAGDPA